MLKKILSYFKSNYHVSVYILCIVYSLLLHVFQDSLIIGIGFTFIFFFSIFVFTKNIFSSLSVVFFVSSQFFLPAKTYQFEYASASEYIEELRPNGIYESIALNISDIVSIFILLLLVKEKIQHLFRDHRMKQNRTMVDVLQNRFAYIPLLCWLLYFLFSLYSSLYLSFSTGYSLNILMQYAKMLISFIAVLQLTILEKSSKNLLYVVLLAMLTFQSGVGVLQFIYGASSYGSTEKILVIDDEQRTAFTRITGILGSANAHAYSIAVLLLLVTPTIVYKKNLILSVIGIFAGINIILSQSRTVWLGSIIIGILSIRYWYTQISFFFMLGFQKKIYYIVMIGILFIAIIYPRIEASALFFTDEGGGKIRRDMMRDAIQLITESPWVGYGVGTSIRVLLSKIPNGYIRFFPDDIHNIFLQIAVESGIPATIVFFIPFLVILSYWVRGAIHRQQYSASFMSVLYCMILSVVYFSLQPIYGRIQFVQLGLILGIGATFYIKHTYHEL